MSAATKALMQKKSTAAALAKRKKKSRKRVRLLGVLMIAAAYVCCCAAVIASLTPKRYAVSEGAAAQETIYAPRMTEDIATTNAMRQAAKNNVSPVYSIDTALCDALISGAQSFFSAVSSFRGLADTIRASSAPKQMGIDGVEYPAEDTRTWEEVIPQADLLTMLLKLPVSISDAALGYAILDASAENLTLLEEMVMTKLQVRLRAGISEKELESVRAEAVKELQVTTLPVRVKQLGELALNAYLLQTNVQDTVSTTRAREEAASNVQTVYIARGAVIVEQGQVVTAEQMLVLTSLDLVKGGNANRFMSVGVCLYLFCVYAMLALWLAAFERETFVSPKRMLMLTLILILNIALQWACYLLEPRVMSVVFGVLLACVLLSRPIATAVCVTLSLSFSLLAGGSGATLLSADCLIALASAMLAGQATILIAEKSEKRGALIAAGAIGGVLGAALIAGGGLILGSPWSDTLVFAGVTMAAALILSVFCVGMLSVWENVFDVVTTTRLHELCNANHPLLKKMMTAAPGTYHHSMMTASLAEGAAEAIGANALLCRAGAMYHDVGKLRRPLYFKENQTGKNIHDTLPPEESAACILAHQRDAEAYLTRYRMPSAVIRIANEHHGTTLVAYFYYQAKREAEESGNTVSEKAFRYTGGLPSTKESAIVMLADSCEAAVRSMEEPSREEVAAMVHRIIQGKMDDGQLAQSPLTLAEIGKIEKSYLITLTGLMHERIRYPGTELPQ